MIVAAKTKADLLFLREFKKCGKTIVATDDGSAGMRGFATDALAETLKEKGFDRVYACGREEMLAKVLKMVQKAGIPAELSTERYMKCGVGLCGQCSLGGKLVCKDGPVFSSDELAKTEFGKYNLDKCGLRVCFDR
jgi:dihydroorotate dehydrogenase electron transfer subunit